MERNILKEFRFKRVENIDPERKSLKELEKYKLNSLRKQKPKSTSRSSVQKSCDFGVSI